MSWIALVALLGVSQSTLLSLLLLCHQSLGQARYWLTALCVGAALVLLDSFAYQQLWHNHYPHLLGLVFPLNLLFAPLVYGYVRHLFGQPLNRRFFWHFLPAVIALLLLLPLYLQSAADKTLLLSNPTTSPWYHNLGILWVVVGSLVQKPIYLALSYRQTRAHLRTLKDFYTSPKHYSLFWLMLLQLVLLLFWLLDISFLLLESLDVSLMPLQHIGDLLIVLIIQIIFALSFQRQDLFAPIVAQQQQNPTAGATTQLDHQPKPSAAKAHEPNNNPLLSRNAVNDELVKYQKSALDTALAQQLYHQLCQHMHSEKSYLDCELSLQLLALQTGFSAHHISQAINQSCGKNFFDFVNHYRVIEVKQLLVQQPQQPILTLALNAGFNSKSAFYSAFRKHTGLTPSAYRQQLA